MLALAIDTSNFVMGVAVAEKNRVIGELVTNEKKNHSVRLMPAIENLLSELDIRAEALDRIVVASGPGSYTGVRIGVTVAKTLAWSLAIPVVGISSLEVLAQNGRYFDGYVSPLFDARRGQIYTGLYGVQESNFSRLQPDCLVLSQQWGEKLQAHNRPVLFLGNDVTLHKQQLEQTLGAHAVFGRASEHNPRPGELAILGTQRKPEKSVHHFVPNYIQLAEAEAKWLAAQKRENS